MLFGCSIATVSNITRITHTWILALNEILYKQFMKNIPSREKNQECLPEFFKDFKDTRIYIDCTEIICDNPNSINSKKLQFSSYKHKDTVKNWWVWHQMA